MVTGPMDRSRGNGGPERGAPERNGQRRRGTGMERHEVPPLLDPKSGPETETETEADTETARTPGGPSFPVLPTPEHDKLTHRLRHAISGFVDAPRGSVEEADALLEEVSTQLVDLLHERRRTLRAAWHDGGGGAAETEELRLAMRGYRNVLERLLSV